MATFPMTSKIFPTTNQVGGEDQGYYTEKNVADRLASVLRGDCVVDGPYIDMADDEVRVYGVYALEGYLVRPQASTVVTIDPTAEVTYLHVSLTKDGASNVTGAEITTSESPEILDKLLIAKAWYDDWPNGGELLWSTNWRMVMFDGTESPMGAPIMPVIRNYGNDIFDHTSGKIYTERTAPYLKNLKPSDTQIIKSWTQRTIEAPDWTPIGEVTAVPNGGRVRFVVTLDDAQVGAYLLVTSKIGNGSSGDIEIPPGQTSVVFEGPYMIAGDTLLIEGKIDGELGSRVISSIAICGDLVSPPVGFFIS